METSNPSVKITRAMDTREYRPPTRDSVVNLIMAYEAGDLTEEGVVALFQHLVDTGLAWRLQGSYGRMAVALIEAGHVNLDGPGPAPRLPRAGDNERTIIS